jgi:uncharacterized protein YndB with AHSA1/START domain
MVVANLAEAEVDALFRALADPTRRDIVRRCADGQSSVSALADAYPMSFAAVQKHVAATIEKHDFVPGGEVTYFMTGPEGDRHRGIWRVTAVDPPTSLEFADIFADSYGTPIADMPVSRVSVRLTKRNSGTRMEMRSKFESRQDLEKWLSTDTLEGQEQAIAQMDVLIGA